MNISPVASAFDYYGGISLATSYGLPPTDRGEGSMRTHGTSGFAAILDRLAGSGLSQLQAALEQVKFEAEQTLFHSRNESDHSVSGRATADQQVEEATSRILLEGQVASLSQANLSPQAAFGLLG